MQTNNKDSKVSYTKGEWSMVTGLKYSNDFFIHARGKVICQMPSDYNIASDKEKANAKLIAAAPELLEACRDAIAQVCNHEDGHKKQFQDAYNKLEAAIKKATEQ